MFRTAFEFGKWAPIYLGWFALIWLYFAFMLDFEMGAEAPVVKLLALCNIAWWAMYEFPRLVITFWRNKLNKKRNPFGEHAPLYE